LTLADTIWFHPAAMDNYPDDIVGGVKVLVPSGMLGAGIDRELVRRGIERGAQVIAVDSGSTDSGPSYLARAVSKMNREAIKRDMEILMSLAHSAGIPILVGSCGTCGADDAVDWTRDIVIEVARNLAIEPRIACLYSEQSRELLRQKHAQGLISALEPMGPLTSASLDKCDHIVALMGPEPYIEALAAGADIVLGGRTTDTAMLAAVPLMRGASAGLAWHAAKVAECGGQCSVHPRLGGVLLTVGREAFEVEPLSMQNQCTPRSVSAHMLYEVSDPYRLIEPGGILDVSEARYEAVNDRVTRVSGSKWLPMPYTLKLEGAGGGPHQTIMLMGIADPAVLANLNEFDARLTAALVERIRSTFGEPVPEFDVSLRFYGWNGVSGRRMAADTAPPPEVGVLFVVTAPTQDLADQMAKACNPYFFHFPMDVNAELPSYAFPFTPAEIPRGRVYEFYLNHVVHVADPHELVRISWPELHVPPQ
jgi:Acyclic terpene utilisation family protein AtuA